jgi:hypothetical protein
MRSWGLPSEAPSFSSQVRSHGKLHGEPGQAGQVGEPGAPVLFLLGSAMTQSPPVWLPSVQEGYSAPETSGSLGLWNKGSGAPTEVEVFGGA